MFICNYCHYALTARARHHQLQFQRWDVGDSVEIICQSVWEHIINDCQVVPGCPGINPY